MLLALISAAYASQVDAAAARVDFTVGSVTVANRNGAQRPLTKGAELDSGDTVKTNDGRAQLRFTDGSYVSLQPNTDFAISEYKYEGKDDDRGFFGLVRGAMRTVTGAVGRVNRNSYRITTPTATVGILGTGGVIQVLNDGSTLVIGTSGIWSLTNPSGSIDIPAGVSGLAPKEPNTPPKETNMTPQTTTTPPPVAPVYVQGDQVNPDGTAAILPSVLVSGSGFAASIAFAGGATPGSLNSSNLQSGSNATAVFNPAGQLTDLTLNGQKYTMNGTQVDFGTDGILAWGRWTGQMTTTLNTCGAAGPATCSANFAPDAGLHYVIGTPTPIMPTTGSATYTLMGATAPTVADGSAAPGTFSGSLGINFATQAVSGNFNVAMASKSYGWSLTTTASNSLFSGSTTIGCGPTCACSCTIGVSGFFAGASAERAGIAYHINDAGPNINIFGAAAFKKN
jgi:hypothetical protein